MHYMEKGDRVVIINVFSGNGDGRLIVSTNAAVIKLITY